MYHWIWWDCSRREVTLDNKAKNDYLGGVIDGGAGDWKIVIVQRCRVCTSVLI